MTLAMAEIGHIDHLVVALSGGKGIGNFRELDLDDLRRGFEGKFFPQLFEYLKIFQLIFSAFSY